jgi:hypothetical protein
MGRFSRTLLSAASTSPAPSPRSTITNVRLYAFLDELHYHRTPHGGLADKTPAAVLRRHPPPTPDGFHGQASREPLTDAGFPSPRPRRLHQSHGRRDWETDLGYHSARKGS